MVAQTNADLLTRGPGPPMGARAQTSGGAPRASRRRGKVILRNNDPLWYKDAIIYEVHVRAFLDSNADGIGDFRGLAQKLDYLQELGVTAIWLLPFYPSPLKDDGYDIADYCSINPIYGTLKDFRNLLTQAHSRNLKVITELVVNHTSDQHPWFQRSRRASPGSLWRGFYVWNDNADKYREARIIFRDFEPSNWTWDPLAHAYYWHRFYSHQPDLNYENTHVHREINRALDFWLDMGVDGLRLDAVPYLYEREDTSCENLPETHDYLKALRRHVDEKYGDRKLFRRLEAGTNPELEVGRFLTARGFANVPAIAGWLDYQRDSREHITLAVLTEFQANSQDAWAYTLDLLSRYFDRVRTAPPDPRLELTSGSSLLELSQKDPPEAVVGLLGTFTEMARLLGQRTAEMHLALAGDQQDAEFAPEPFTPFYQRGLFQSMRNLAVRSLEQLRRGLERVPESARPEANQVIASQSDIIKRLHAIYETPLNAKRIRCHGDFHLGEVLFTGKDFIFIDFESEPGRPLGERRIKRSPLRDVASMLRSFAYIAAIALLKQLELGALQEHDLPVLEPWAAFWFRWTSAIYLKAYLKALGETGLLPASKDHLGILLDAHLLEKTLREAAYELNNRPHLLKIPLRGVLYMLRPKDSK